MMRNKLGLYGADGKDKSLILDLLTWMHQKKKDYTNTFCHLMSLENQKDKSFEDNDFQNWKKRWRDRLEIKNNTPEKFIKLMRRVNPLVIPRNHKVEEALSEANHGNLKPTIQFLEILKNPYNEKKSIDEYQMPSLSNKNYKTFCGT